MNPATTSMCVNVSVFNSSLFVNCAVSHLYLRGGDSKYAYNQSFMIFWFIVIFKIFYYYLIFTFWFKVLTTAFTVICHDLSVSSVCRHYHIIIFTGCISLSVFAELLWWMFFRRSSGRLASDVCILAYICLDGCLLNYRVHWTKVDDIAASIRVSMDAVCVQCCLSCVELPHLFWGLLTSIYCTKL